MLIVDGEKALSFVLGVLLSLRIIFYVVYTAPGFALFPITLIKRIPTLQISDVDTARQALDHNRELQRRIEVRYQGTGQQMSMKDRKELEALQREERTLTRRHRLAEESGNRDYGGSGDDDARPSNPCSPNGGGVRCGAELRWKADLYR